MAAAFAAIDNFIAKYLQSEHEQKFIDRFEEIKQGILTVKGCFVVDGVGSHVWHWIWDGTPLEIWQPKTHSHYSAGVYGEYDITELYDHVTDFVAIDGKTITLIPNNEFDGTDGLKSTRKYFLPSLQREFVWKPDQIERLFDSLMRQFPIGSFLFWQVPPEKFGDFIFYEFMRDYHELTNRHNDEATETLGEIGHALDAVLDGQQRMNALYIGLKGSYGMRKKRHPPDKKESYEVKRLYLNLLNKETLDDIEELSSNFGVIKLLQRENLADSELAAEILSTLYERINKDLSMHYYLVGSADLDSALNIFIRVNNGGTVLKPADLVFSFVTTGLHGKHNVRDEINEFLGELNDIGGKKNFEIDKDTILKALLFLSDGNVRFKTASFNKDIMKVVDDRRDEFLAAIRLTVANNTPAIGSAFASGLSTRTSVDCSAIQTTARLRNCGAC